MTVRSTGGFLGVPALLLAILGVAFVMRAPVTSVPPALAAIQADLGLSPSLAGATTSLPLICFGVFAFAAPFLIARVGLERTMFAVVLPLLAGILLRSAGDVTVFFTGTVLVGIGIALGNVLVPALLRSRFGLRAAVYAGWYTAMLQVSGAMGSWLTAPLQGGAGFGWRGALAAWTLPVLAATAAWALVARAAPPARATATPSGMGHIARRPLCWAITLFMGMQSLTFYTLLTWLPHELVDVGLSTSAAGLVLGVFSILGLPGALIAPRLTVSRHCTATVVVTYVVQAVGTLLLLVDPTAAVVGAVLCGLTQGSGFAIALTFIAHQPDHRDVPPLSALAQGAGYLFAALGPVAIGAAFAATGGWLVPNLILIGGMAALIVAGSYVGPRLRRSHLGD